MSNISKNHIAIPIAPLYSRSNYPINGEVPLKNSNGNNNLNKTRKIQFKPTANVREYISNNPFKIHQGPKSNTAKRWKNKGSPSIYRRVPNNWKDRVAHIAAMVYTKNTRNNMIRELVTNPHVDSVIQNYYNDQLAKEREGNKNKRRNNSNSNSNSNRNNNSNSNNSVTNAEILSIYKNDMIKDVIDHLDQKISAMKFNQRNNNNLYY